MLADTATMMLCDGAGRQARAGRRLGKSVRPVGQVIDVDQVTHRRQQVRRKARVSTGHRAPSTPCGCQADTEWLIDHHHTVTRRAIAIGGERGRAAGCAQVPSVAKPKRSGVMAGLALAAIRLPAARVIRLPEIGPVDASRRCL